MDDYALQEVLEYIKRKKLSNRKAVVFLKVFLQYFKSRKLERQVKNKIQSLKIQGKKDNNEPEIAITKQELIYKLFGIWKGYCVNDSFRCRLEFTTKGTGVFYFSNTKQKGSYYITCVIEEDDILYIKGTKWIKRPHSNFSFINLEGRFSNDYKEIKGDSILVKLQRKYGTFRLKKVQ